LSLSTNYTLTFLGANFTINPKPASVTPNPASKTYGDADPVLTGTLSGFLPSDHVTAVFARATGEDAGTYTINAALAPAGVLANYTITYTTASFVIVPLAASRYGQNPLRPPGHGFASNQINSTAVLHVAENVSLETAAKIGIGAVLESGERYPLVANALVPASPADV
jgi:hypothetical protein